MPPLLPNKLEQSKGHSSGEKESLFEAADTSSTPKKTVEDNKHFLEKFEKLGSESSLSEFSSEEFEDVPSPDPKRRKISKKEEEDDEEVDWEDAIEHTVTPSNGASRDLDLTLDQNDATGSLTTLQNGKKGPSKIEREIRISTHRMHVQYLLFHNLLRSRWACDSEVQKILLDQIPEQIRLEVDKWRKDSGFNSFQTMSSAKVPKSKAKKGKNGPHGERNQRDWGKPAEKQEHGEPNMSAGDPVIRLLKCLSAYWRKKFDITAPGLRKQGYRTLPMLEEHIASLRRRDDDIDTHGERIDGIEGFRRAARISQGSRDIGAQLFTALLRGLGIESRVVASLQPIGFGWSKNEDASVKRKRDYASSRKTDESGLSSSSSNSDSSNDAPQRLPSTSRSKTSRKVTTKGRKSTGAKDAPIELLDDDQATSVDEDDDNGSVIDVTPKVSQKKCTVLYDRDLPAPNYWTEVVSPITFQVYPVDSLVSKIPVITSSEYLSHFEPRGVKADKAKQVFAYVIAYSSDGTAKDVTTRYLKRHLWPGRTKGVRLPPEKIPIYNRKGKIKKHEEYDWFKTVMSGYERPYSKRTAVDDLEDEKDLKRAKLEKKEANIREDTLQFYKTSAEFVLERHLRREEAIKPGSKPVRTFVSGKGDDTKEQPVFKRHDVEVCRTGESWHKEGRAIKPGQHPWKMVPIRAVTLTRKREVEEAERDTGEKQKQGLYARNQTDWIIPPPIEDGRIPKNAYGNIDCFVPTMIPKGAVHIPLRKTVMVCRKLGIDYAEAVTGFEFGNKMAVPVIEGVVVAEHHEDLVIDQWEKDEKERKIKEEGKREKMALGTWRKWLMGLRIIQRVKEEYGGDPDADTREALNPFTNQSKVVRGKHKANPPQEDQGPLTRAIDDEELGGGFVHDDNEDDVELESVSKGNEKAPQHSEQLIIEGVDEEAHGRRRGLAVLAANATNETLDDQIVPSKTYDDSEQESDTTPPSPKPTKSSRPTKKAVMDSETVEISKSNHRQKRKARFSSPESVRKSVRTVPKRGAARHSETAVKSHYFNSQSDEDSSPTQKQDEDSESEEVVAQSLRRKPKKPGRTSKKRERVKGF